MQHTRRWTRLQHTKYYSHASYNHAAYKDGSCAAHEIELTCSTRKINLVSHTSSVQVTQQKYKNTCVLLHTSVNLEMSCTVPGFLVGVYSRVQNMYLKLVDRLLEKVIIIQFTIFYWLIATVTLNFR